MVLDHRERLILLNLIADIGSTRLRRLLDHFGGVDRVWQATAAQLQQVEGIGPGLVQRMISGRADEVRLHQELASAQRTGVRIITLEEAEYPAPLRTIHDPPLALYIRGRLVEADQTAVAIVGARHASRYGLECAERLGYELALRGLTVVSGLARGIDAAAHRGALKASGRTLAVLGSGLGRLYPEEHETLAKQVGEQGAVISEYPMDMAPLPHNFPRRNRLISGLSLGVVVVEAGPRSGSLITADCALEQGRDVFAVPGPVTSVTSQGTHRLIKQGARLVTSVEDILDELHLTPQGPPQVESRQGVDGAIPLSVSEERVLECLNASHPTAIDVIAMHCGVPIADVSSALLQMELKRMVQQLPGKRFVRLGR